MDLTNAKKFVEENYDYIVFGLKDSWSEIQKIRYVYLRLGEFLEKNTDFFENSKLALLKKDDDELFNIYINDIMPIRKYVGGKQYQVICKSAAYCLKLIYDRLSIHSALVHTIATNSIENEIVHWFLVVKYDDKQIFLTLNPDLPYIKNNFETQHFGSNIGIILTHNLKEVYELPDDAQIKLVDKVYYDSQGNAKTYREIEHEVLVPTSFDSHEKIREKEKMMKALDESIGYGKLYESKMFVSTSELKNFYIRILEEKSEIYSIFFKAFKLNDVDYVININDITLEMIKEFKINLNKYVVDFLNKKLKLSFNFKNYEYYEEIYACFLKYITNIECNDSFTDTMNKYKSKIKEEKKSELDLIKAVVSLEKRLDRFIDLKTEYEKLKEPIPDTKLKELNLFGSRMGFNLRNIAKNIIELYNYSSEQYIPQKYILDKFLEVFPRIFEIKFAGLEITTEKTSFSIQSYSEQKKIVDEVFGKLYSELSIKNCGEMPEYNNERNALDNRIRIFPLKDKNSGEYCIGFRFLPNLDKDEEEVEYIYIPSQNLLRKHSPLADRNYMYVSNSLKVRFVDSENIENIMVRK